MASCSSSDGGGEAGGSGGSGQGGSGQGGTGQGGTGQGGTGQGGTGQGGTGGSSSDPYALQRQACIDKINALRATKGLAPYARWTEKESCVDQQSTGDEASGKAHDNFGNCGESSQNECLGGGAANIEQCLDSMWGEKDATSCSGCDACADKYTPNCANCDFYGTNGPQCGHYVSMSAHYYTKAACGFSAGGGWATIDFQ